MIQLTDVEDVEYDAAFTHLREIEARQRRGWAVEQTGWLDLVDDDCGIGLLKKVRRHDDAVLYELSLGLGPTSLQLVLDTEEVGALVQLLQVVSE
jgi:hypothetical protein